METWFLYNFFKLVSYTAVYWAVLVALMVSNVIPDYSTLSFAFAVAALVGSVGAFFVSRHLKTIMGNEEALLKVKNMK